MTIQVTIPGKVMLSGEYSVLSGKPCITTAVDRWLVLEIEAHREGFLLESNLWPEPEVYPSLEHMPSHDLFALAVKKSARYCYWEAGAKVRIVNSFPVTYGLGSSSALWLGVLLGFHSLRYGQTPSEGQMWSLAQEAFQWQKSAQSQASGYDFATQVHGGCFWWRPEEALPGAIRAYPNLSKASSWLRLIAGGQGNQTKETLEDMGIWLKTSVGQTYLEHMERFTGTFDGWLRRGGEPDGAFFAQMGALRALQREAPHFPRSLEDQLISLQGCDETWSFKTTGAGGEDTLLVVGSEEATAGVFAGLRASGWQPEPLSMAGDGIKVVRKGLV